MFFANATAEFDRVSTGSFSAEDWSSALRRLILRMGRGIRDALLQPYESLFHDLVKTLFVEHYEAPLKADQLSGSARVACASEAREFLDGVETLLGAQAVGDTVLVSLSRAVQQVLIRGREDRPATSCDVAPALQMRLWAGAKKQIMLPLFTELRHNAEKALSTFTEETAQTYRVVLQRQTHGGKDYGVLTVANACGEHDTALSVSRGKGLRTIPFRARELGAVSFGPEEKARFEDTGCPKWEWTFWFPLMLDEARVAEGEKDE